MDDTLDPEQIEQCRSALGRRRTELLTDIADGTEGSDTVNLDQSRVGRLSRMDAMQAQAMAQASQQRRGEELKRVISALQRIEEEDYGFCLECGDPIPWPRLQYDPSVEYCVRCAEEREKG